MRFLLYIDPGSGSLLYQAILSILATSILFFNKIKTYGFFIWSVFKKTIKGN